MTSNIATSPNQNHLFISARISLNLVSYRFVWISYQCKSRFQIAFSFYEQLQLKMFYSNRFKKKTPDLERWSVSPDEMQMTRTINSLEYLFRNHTGDTWRRLSCKSHVCEIKWWMIYKSCDPNGIKIIEQMSEIE